MGKIDLRRALEISGSETVPAEILSQPEIDKLITQLVDFNNPVRQNMPRKKGSGYAWHINRRAAAGQTYSAFTADTNTFSQFEGTGTYSQHDFIYRTIGAQGKVTRKVQAVGASYSNVLADELEAKAMEFRDKEDWAMLWSTEAGTTLPGYNANGFTGLYHLADPDETAPYNYLCPALVTGNTVGALTLDDIDRSIDTIRGDCNMIITSKKGRRIINSLLQTAQRFNDTIEVKGGFKVLSYNNIPIFTSSNCMDTGAFDVDGESGGLPGVTNLTAGDSSIIFFLDTTKVFMGELTPLTVMPLAKTTSQYDEFDIYVDETVVCRDPKGIAILTGFST